MLFHRRVTPEHKISWYLCGERHYENKVYCPRTQHSAPARARTLGLVHRTNHFASNTGQKNVAHTSSRFSSVLSGPSSLSNFRKVLIWAALILISVVSFSDSPSIAASSSWSGITTAESSGSSSWSSSMVVDSVERWSGPGMLFLGGYNQ